MDSYNTKYKVIGAYLLILIFCACGAKKKSTERVEVVRDSIVYVERIAEGDGINTTFNLDKLCDSTGTARQFTERIVYRGGKDTVEVRVEDNTLRFKLSSQKDTISHYKNLYREALDKSKIVETKTRSPRWLVIAFVIESLLILGYIYYWIRRFFSI